MPKKVFVLVQPGRYGSLEVDTAKKAMLFSCTDPDFRHARNVEMIFAMIGQGLRLDAIYFEGEWLPLSEQTFRRLPSALTEFESAADTNERESATAH